MAAAVPGGDIQRLPIQGGSARSIPGTAGLSPIRWCRDGTLLAARPGGMPVHIVRVDVESGRQLPWKELAPKDLTALGTLTPIRVAADCETYAYTAQYDPSMLFVVSGLR